MLLSLCVVVATGCETETFDVPHSDAGPDTGPDTGPDGSEPCAPPRVECASTCCEEGEKCFRGACCEPKCTGRECGDDGCGGTCGSCGNGIACLIGGTCERCSDSEEAICARNPDSCGRLQLTDRCGEEREVTCPDRCVVPKSCNLSSATCSCEPEGDKELCDLVAANLGAECGSGTVLDRCGVERAFECGDCAYPERCNNENRCTCDDFDLAEICQRNSKECGKYQALDACGVARVIPSCGDCDQTQTCRDNQCAAPGAPPVNDDCDGVVSLILVNGAIEFETDTSIASESTYTAQGSLPISNSCSVNYGGRDVVYSFTLSTPSDVQVSATPINESNVVPVIYLRSDCDDMSAQFICNSPDTLAGIDTAMINAKALPAGTWFLWIDDFAPEDESLGGPLAISILAAPVTTPSNDRCTNAFPMPPFSANSTMVEGSTKGTAKDGPFSVCAVAGGDLFYSFTLERDSGVLITLSSTGTSDAYVPAFQLVESCDEETQEELYCANSVVAGHPTAAVKKIPSLTRGTYYIAVSSTDLHPGEFQLHIDLHGDSPNDTCDSPRELILDSSSHSITFEGTTAMAAKDDALTCAVTGKDGPELMFQVRTPAGVKRDLFAKIIAPSGSSFRGGVEIRESCTEANSALSCDRAEKSREVYAATYSAEPATNYFILVASETMALTGKFLLTITSSEVPVAPGNDACGALTTSPEAYTLTADSSQPGHYLAKGSTRATSDDMKGSCNNFAGGGDALFAVTLANDADAHFVVTASEKTPGFIPVAYIKSACGTGIADELGCLAATHSTISDKVRADLGAVRLSAGTYYLVVDSYVSSGKALAGDFTVDAYIKSPPYSNQLCADAETLILSAEEATVLHADTAAGGTLETEYSCHYPGRDGPSGRELFYKVVLPPGHFDLSIKVTPGENNNMFSIIAIKEDCSAPPRQELACGYAKTGGTNSLTAPKLPGSRSYMVIFDSHEASGSGTFSATFTLRDADVIINTSCSGAIDFPAPDESGNIPAIIDTLDGDPDDHHAPCANTSGGDLVYRFDHPGTYDVVFTLTPSPDTDNTSTIKSTSLALYIKDGCGDDAKNLACIAGITNKTPYSVLRSGVVGPLYVFVDGMDKNASKTFSLAASTRSSGTPPENDSCELPGSLSLDPATLTASTTGSTKYATNGGTFPCATGQTTLNGPDVVYVLDIEQSGRLSASVSSMMPAIFKPAIYIQRDSCMPIAPSANVLCAYSSASGIALASAYVAPGRYYIHIGGATSASEGTFGLNLSLQPTPRLNDTCASIWGAADETILELSTPSVRIDASTSYASHNSTSTSLPATHNGSGADVVYRLDVKEPMVVEASLAFAGYGEAILYLSERCGESGIPDLASAWQLAGGPATISTRLDQGKYWLWVDSTFPNQDDFALKLTTTPLPVAPATSCSIARELALFDDRVTQEIATTVGATAVMIGADARCAGAVGGEVIYHFKTTDLSEPRLFRAKVTPPASNISTFAPILYVRTACESSAIANEVGCAAGTAGSAEVVVPIVQPNKDYWLVVDGTAPGMDYQLTAGLYPALPDKCPATPSLAYTIPLDGDGHGHISGNNTGSTNDLARSCGTASAAIGYDVVYRLDLSSIEGAKDLHIQYGFGGANSTLNGYYAKVGIFLQRGACDLDSHLDCVMPTTGTGYAALKHANVAPDVYWIWLDGDSTQNGYLGRFDLTVDLLPAGSPSPTDEQSGVLSARCANTQNLPIVEFGTNGIAIIRGNTNDGYNDGLGTKCNHDTSKYPAYMTQSGKELVYRVPIDSSALEIIVSPAAGSKWRPLVELRSQCDSITSSVTCDAKDWWYSFELRASFLASATYYLVIDTTREEDANNPITHGEFIVTLRKTNNNYSSNADTCESLASRDGYTLVRDQPLVLAGDLGSGAANHNGSCGSANAGNEHIYKLTITEPSVINATIMSGQTVYTTLYLRSKCADTSTQIGCARSDSSIGRIQTGVLAPGDYYLFADDQYASANLHGFSVTVEAIAPAGNNTCMSAQHLTLTNGKAHIEIADIGAGTNTLLGSCSLPGPELVYSLDLPADSLLSIWTHTPNSIVPGVYLLRNCKPAAEITAQDELFCSAIKNDQSGWGSQLLINKTVKEANRYYLYIDSANVGARGAMSFDIAVTPMYFLPENDYCASPFPSSATLAFSFDQATAAGRIEDASNLSAGKCGAMPGPDKVYSFTLPFERSFVARLTAEFKAALYLRTACDDPNTEFGTVACATNTSTGQTATIGSSRMPAGTYYIWVDSTEATATGGFNLSLALGDIGGVNQGDTCETDGAPLSFVTTGNTSKATSIGNTMLSDNTTTGTCAAMLGQDIYYKLHLETARKLTAKLTPQGAWKGPALVLRNSCDDTSLLGQQGCVAGTSTSAITLTRNNLGAGDYFLWVDTTATDQRGEYILDVTLDNPGALVPGDLCETAKEVFLGTNSVTMASAGNEYTWPNLPGATNGCQGSTKGNGWETVFTYTPATADPFTVTVTPGSFNAQLWLGTACDYSTCLLGVDAQSTNNASGFETFTWSNTVAGQTYYIFVESSSTSGGAFTIKVE